MSSPLPDFIITAWAVVDNGVEGRGPRTVMYLCETESHANKLLESNVNKAYYYVHETQAVSMDGLLIETQGEVFNASTGESKGRKDRIRSEALAKLNSEEKRILGIKD